MIEKLEPLQGLDHSWLNKINELVDAVNELQEMRKSCDNQIGILAEQIAKLQHDNSEKPQDKFAEQRKWIGKLCRFRDKDYKDDQWDYGLLQAVEKAETAHIWKTGCFKHNLGHWYDFCEPVKPDDDIIYKGDDNEL